MKAIKIAFAVARLFMNLMMTDKGRATVDGMLDLVEDAFYDDEKAQKACAKVREALILPDDD